MFRTVVSRLSVVAFARIFVNKRTGNSAINIIGVYVLSIEDVSKFKKVSEHTLNFLLFVKFQGVIVSHKFFSKILNYERDISKRVRIVG